MNKILLPVSFLVLFILAACTSPARSGISTVPAPAFILPTANVPLPRWKYWERALGDILNGPSGNTHPDLNQDHGICEWEIYGQKGNEVYVWAYCEVYHKGIGITASAGPAIVRLAADDSISEVVFPEDITGIRPLVPADIWARIMKRDFDVARAEKNIGLRNSDPSIPPLIIQQGVTLP